MNSLKVLSIHGSGKVLLNARVDSGKTFVALACASTIISNDTGYMSKVLSACPLVALAKEQYGLIRRYCTTQEKQHPALRVQSVAYRAGKKHQLISGKHNSSWQHVTIVAIYSRVPWR
jgi:hypothetical protein